MCVGAELLPELQRCMCCAVLSAEQSRASTAASAVLSAIGTYLLLCTTEHDDPTQCKSGE